MSAASESLSDTGADDNWIRESEKDSLAVRESSAGRVAFTLGNCTGTNATAGEARTCPPIRPFKMHVPERVLIDLRRRLAEANWPD